MRLKDRDLYVEMLRTGFPEQYAQELADEVIAEAEDEDEAFILVGRHLTCGGQFKPRLRIAA